MGGTTGQALGGHRASRIWAWRACKASGFVIFGLGFVISRLGFVILRLGFAIARLGFEDLRLEGFEGARLRRFGASFQNMNVPKEARREGREEGKERKGKARKGKKENRTKAENKATATRDGKEERKGKRMGRKGKEGRETDGPEFQGGLTRIDSDGNVASHP